MTRGDAARETDAGAARPVPLPPALLSLFASQGPFGAKVVVHAGHEFAVGD